MTTAERLIQTEKQARLAADHLKEILFELFVEGDENDFRRNVIVAAKRYNDASVSDAWVQYALWNHSHKEASKAFLAEQRATA